ncbi:MAG: hypothetical protein NTZ50_14515, partial [Chloroflexi bacterium]|nr:hypothetical protein [Chloroflexota bacterium]
MNRFDTLLTALIAVALVAGLIAMAISGSRAPLRAAWVDPMQPLETSRAAAVESFVAPWSDVPRERAPVVQPVAAPAPVAPLRGAFAIDFALQRDALTFRNYGSGFPEGDMSIDDLRKLFGDGVCARFVGVRCIPTPAAQLWLDMVTDYMRAGHCAGFTVMSSRFWLNNLQSSAFANGAAKPFDLPQNVPVMKQIARDWSLQVLPELTRAAIRGTPRQIVAEMLRRSRNGDARMVDLGIFKRGGGGHSLLAYGVQEMGGQKFHIQVYDNNWPGKPLYVEVDARADTWRYSLGASNPSTDPQAWEGDAFTQSLMFVPIDSYFAKMNCPFCPPQSNAAAAGEVGVAVSGRNLSVQIADGQGRRSGLVEGRYVAEIPGSHVVPLRDALYQDQAPLVMLPATTTVSILLEPQPGVLDASGNVHVTGSGYALAIEGLMAQKLNSSRMSIVASGAGVVLTPAIGSRLTVKVTTEHDGVATLATVAQMNTSAGGSIVVGMDKEGQLQVSGAAAQGSSVIVARVNAQGSSVFATMNLQVPPGAVLQVQVRNWNGASAPPAVMVQGEAKSTSDVKAALPAVVFYKSLPSVRDPKSVAQVLGTTAPYLNQEEMAALVAQLVKDGATGRGLGWMLASIDPAVFDPAWLVAAAHAAGMTGANLGLLVGSQALDDQAAKDLLASLGLSAEDMAAALAGLGMQTQAENLTEQVQFGNMLDDARALADLFTSIKAPPQVIGMVLNNAGVSPATIVGVIDVLQLVSPEIIVVLDALEPPPTDLTAILSQLALAPDQASGIVISLNLPPSESDALVQQIVAATATPMSVSWMTATSSPFVMLMSTGTPQPSTTPAPGATGTPQPSTTPVPGATGTPQPSTTPAIPGNDGIAAAVEINSGSFSVQLDTSRATTSTSDPILSCIQSQGVASVWFYYRPSTSGLLDVDTTSSSYKTAVALFEMVNNVLVLKTCASNGHLVSSRVLYGQELYIEVVGVSGARGGEAIRNPLIASQSAAMQLIFILNGPPPGAPAPTATSAPPANDNFGAWHDVNVVPFSQAQNINSATSYTTDPMLCGTADRGIKTVWYRYKT